MSDQYILDENKYHKIETPKRQIIISDTLNVGMRHHDAWVNRFNGKYKKTAHFTISRDGEIHFHVDPLYATEYFDDPTINNSSIFILLENVGWLTKNNDTNTYYDYLGNIYKGDVYQKKWRNREFWAKYTEEQHESAVNLCRLLCEDFNISKFAIQTNIRTNMYKTVSGIVYASNITERKCSANPSWDFKRFKTDVENEEHTEST